MISEGASELPITDERMTRFWITLDQGCEFVGKSLERMYGGEVFVPKIPSVRIMDLAKAMAPNLKTKIIGIRPGEKLHEVMCPAEDSHATLEFHDHYVIKPAIRFTRIEHHYRENKIGESGVPVQADSEYSSDINPHFMTVDEIQSLNEKLGF